MAGFEFFSAGHIVFGSGATDKSMSMSKEAVAGPKSIAGYEERLALELSELD